MTEEITTCEKELAQIDKTLNKIRRQIDEGNVQSNIELETLQSNLIELRELTQDKLLELRKNAVLNMLDNFEDESLKYPHGASEQTSNDCQITLDNCDNEIFKNCVDNHIDEDNTFTKTIPKLKIDISTLKEQRCSFPYWTSNGIFLYQNAIVHDIDLKSQQASLVVCNPTRLCEVPCDNWLLTDSCNNSSCAYSHGINVSFNNLYEYQDPDFLQLVENSRCLCLLENETVWWQAIIQHVDLPNECCYLYLTGCKFEQSICVSLCNILPLHFKLSNAINSSSKYDMDNEDSDDVLLMDAFNSQLTADNGKPFGDWERFTRGIGSKIMASMGYVRGRGLGKLEDGRANPVPIEVLPTRRSLDKIMRLRNKKLEPTLPSSSSTRNMFHKNKNVFSFMNKHLCNDRSNGGGTKKTKDGKNDSKIIEEHSLTKKSDKDIAVQVYKTSNEITRVKSQIGQLKSSLERHTGTSTLESIKKRIGEKETYLEKLMVSEKSLLRHQEHRSNTKKLKIF